jgi:hypothetical protein
MLVRPYHSSDGLSGGLDRLLRGTGPSDVRPDKDHIFVTGSRGNPDGVLVYRAGAFVHQLECGSGPRRRLRADLLCNYAIVHARSSPHVLRSAIFLVRGDNLPMQRYIESFPGVVKQSDPGDVLYTLTPE